MTSGPATEDGVPARDSIRRGTATTLVTYVTTAAFTAILTLYLVRALGPEAYGIFSLALGVAGVASIVVDFGIAASLSRYMAEQFGDRRALASLFAGALRLKLLLAGSVGFALCALAGPIAAAYDAPEAAWPIRAVAIATILQSVMGQFSGAFFALGRATVNLRVVIGESAVECGASLALVLLGGGATGAAFGRTIGYAVGALLGLALAVRLLGRSALDLRARSDRRMATMGRYALWTWLVNGVYTAFTQIDLLVIGAVLGPVAVGAFGAPSRLTALISYPALAVANTVSPRIARRQGAPPNVELLADALRALLVVQALLLAPLLVWAQPIASIVLGGAYGESVPVLRALVPYIYLQGPTIVLSLAVNYLGGAQRRLVYAVLALVINVVLDLLLLPVWGVAAAAVATSLAYAVFAAGHLRIAADLTGLRIRSLALTAARTLLAAAAMAGVLASFGTSGIGPLDWIAGLGLAAAAFGVALFALGELTPGSARAVAARLRGRR